VQALVDTAVMIITVIIPPLDTQLFEKCHHDLF
jgi:hypothetical protein